METSKNLTARGGLLVLIAICFFALTNSCSNSTSAPPTNEVFIQNMAFSPATITVTVGTTVKWTNKDGITHTVTSDTGLFNSGNVNADGVFSYMFMTAGTYNYHCTIHPNMVAKVVVN